MDDKEKMLNQIRNDLTMVQRLVELSPEALYIMSEGKCVFTNTAGAELMGANCPSELIGQPIVDVLNVTRTSNVMDFVEVFLEEKSVPRIEKKFIRLDGTTVDVEAAAVPIFFNNKPAIQLMAHDITRRKRTEEALRNSEERFRHLVNNAPLGFILIDKLGKIITMNPSLIKLIDSLWEGNEPENLMEFPPFIDSGISASISKCIELGEPIFAEHLCADVKGNKIWLHLYLTPVEHVNEKIKGAQILVEDITSRKQAEQELVKKDLRIQKELQLANTIQASLFPVNLPQIRGAIIAATAVPANEVGGDYCDLFVTKSAQLGIAIGDVMGKGVPAALFVAMLYAIVRSQGFECNNPNELVNRLNRNLYPQLELTEQFITFFYALYNPETRELKYTNAGHNPPIVFRKETGETECLKVRDFFLGGCEEANYREGVTVLNPGDIILFYTDGLKEGMNAFKEQFGMDRIINLLKENCIYDPASIQEILSCEFYDFLAGMPPYDDVTMIIIKIDE